MKEYLEHSLAEARKAGFTRTLFGRRRPIPEITSPQVNLRNLAERTALNTPLQGTAADLIKLAMIHIDRELAAQKFRARMILQVHDELLFEAPPEELDRLRALVRPAMEQVHKLRRAAGRGHESRPELARYALASRHASAGRMSAPFGGPCVSLSMLGHKEPQHETLPRLSETRERRQIPRPRDRFPRGQAPPRRREKMVLVDVREDSEWAHGHLPGAMHLGKGVIERDIEQVFPR